MKTQEIKNFSELSEFILGDKPEKDKIAVINSTDFSKIKLRVFDAARLLASINSKVLLSVFLSSFKDYCTVEFLPCIAPYLKDDDKRVRANAVEAISAISNSESARKLLIPYLKDKDNRVKANTALALWKYEDMRESLCSIFDDMAGDHSKWMRASAYYAFGEIGIQEFLNRLLDALEDKDADACKTAVVALVSYCEKVTQETK
jgi:HEAT repeat protein